MTHYIARVVLHGSKNEKDYEQLHEDMFAKDYFRIIKGDTGHFWRMPPAMYTTHVYGSDVKIERKRIIEAVEKRWKHEYSIFVAHIDSSAWVGLEDLGEG